MSTTRRSAVSAAVGGAGEVAKRALKRTPRVRKAVAAIYRKFCRTPPSPAPAARSKSAHGGSAGHPWRSLRENGLRVEKGIRVFARAVRIEFEAPVQINNAALSIYRNVRIGRYSYLRTGTIRYVDEIGRYTSIGPGVILGEAEHPTDWLTTSPAAFFAKRYDYYPPEVDAVDRVIRRTDENTTEASRGIITIGHDVWIGANVMVRRGVTIGNGAIVGSGAFVNRDIPPYAIVGGLPAKLIGYRFDDGLIERLQRVAWWEFDISELAGVPFDDVDAALDRIEEWERDGRIHRAPARYSSVVLTNRGFDKLHVDPGEQLRTADRLQRWAAQRRT